QRGQTGERTHAASGRPSGIEEERGRAGGVESGPSQSLAVLISVVFSERQPMGTSAPCPAPGWVGTGRTIRRGREEPVSTGEHSQDTGLYRWGLLTRSAKQ